MSALHAEITALDAGELPRLAEEWQALESRAEPIPYLSFSWICAWAEVYAPGRLRLIRVLSPAGEVSGLGLLVERAGGRLRFAGGAASPVRCLLTAPGDEASNWDALGSWLAANSRAWGALELDGAPAPAARMVNAHATATSWFGLDLPDSFESYLEARPASTRKSLVRKLRAAEKAGAAVRQVPGGELGGALADFVRLHARRAQAKGEVHAHMDGRVAELLGRVAARANDYAGAPTVNAVAITHEERTAAVTVRIDHRQASWFFNAGFDPAASRLSPGLVAELGSIRAAIAAGSERYDLGPGDYRYKRDLGGSERQLSRVVLTSSSLRGRLAGLGLAARRNPWLRRARDAVRSGR